MRAALFSLCALALATACVPAPGVPTTSPGRSSALWPDEVVQALPPGVPDDAVLRDSDGCYSFRDPTSLSGFGLVIGIDGRQLCDGRFPDEAEIRARAAAMRADLEMGNTNVVDLPPAQ
jgi:hypothetical protein